MYTHRNWQAALLGAILLLMYPAVDAKRPGPDDHPRYQLSQSESGKGSAPERGWSRNRGGEARPEPRFERGRDDRDQRGGEEQPRAAPRGMGLSEAVSEAERRTGGRVLSAEPRGEGGQTYYRVKVLGPDGRVQILNLDAR